MMLAQCDPDVPLWHVQNHTWHVCCCLVVAGTVGLLHRVWAKKIEQPNTFSSSLPGFTGGWLGKGAHRDWKTSRLCSPTLLKPSSRDSVVVGLGREEAWSYKQVQQHDAARAIQNYLPFQRLVIVGAFQLVIIGPRRWQWAKPSDACCHNL